MARVCRRRLWRRGGRWTERGQCCGVKRGRRKGEKTKTQTQSEGVNGYIPYTHSCLHKGSFHCSIDHYYYVKFSSVVVKSVSRSDVIGRQFVLFLFTRAFPKHVFDPMEWQWFCCLPCAASSTEGEKGKKEAQEVMPRGVALIGYHRSFFKSLWALLP